MSKFKVGDKVQVVSERGLNVMSSFKLDGNSTVGEVADTYRYRCPDGATVTMQYAVHFHRQQTENGAFVRLWFHENELKLHQSETDCTDAPEAPLTNAEIKALRLVLTREMFNLAPATETQQEQPAEPRSKPSADWPQEFEDLFIRGLPEKVFIRGKHDLQRSLFLHGYRAGYDAALKNESGSRIRPYKNPKGGQSEWVNPHITKDNPLGIYVGAKVRLRDGSDATIDFIAESGWVFPVNGQDGFSYKCSWTRGGSYNTDGEHQFDIIEVLQPEAV